MCSGEEAQAWQVPGLYKAPNEGLLAKNGGGMCIALVEFMFCWLCAYCIGNNVSATVSLPLQLLEW